MLPHRLPYSGAHWVDHVARHAYSAPDAAAIRYQGESITWARLHDRVRSAAAAFAGQGVSRGDRVAVLMTNRPEFIESVLAANALGAIAVPVNFRLAPAEAAYVLQDSGAALVVTDPLLTPLATKDMIISGGENIYCAEVENALSGHPAVADVAVIGARHEKWGETPIAVVVPADPAAPPTLDDLAGWTAGKLASYKKPTGLVILAELPRNASGKVPKHELRARYGQP